MPIKTDAHGVRGTGSAAAFMSCGLSLPKIPHATAVHDASPGEFRSLSGGPGRGQGVVRRLDSLGNLDDSQFGYRPNGVMAGVIADVRESTVRKPEAQEICRNQDGG
jgi:hypothetical protein